MKANPGWLVLFVCTLFIGSGGGALGQQYNPDWYPGLQWRLIGPHRGGRVTAVAGIKGKPAVYYMGTPGGGVWKTTDGGRVWKPIFDDAHVASIGALALAPSNPDVIYVGTGEQTEGKGVYKSTDGGATWTNIGLRETHYISSIIVDPSDPNIVLAGAFGDFTPSEMRGVFKTTDGGRKWNRVLFENDKSGVADMCPDPGNSRTIFAATWARPFARGEKPPTVPDAQIFKSADQGTTWRRLSGAGLPDKVRGRIGVAVAPGTDGRRVYAIMNQGFFRSDDAGESWRQMTTDPRILGNGYFSRAFVDPNNADMVYVVQTTMYRSTDGGQTFEAYKGAPSGEDEHVLWIDPANSQRMILGSDQGAVISMDGGRTWSSWFNQPTGQFYHVTTDNAFPYHAYLAQQDSGTVAVPTRSDFGQITYREWFSVGGFESGHIAPDPANPNLIYSVGWFGAVLRMDRMTGQLSTVFVPGAKYRYAWETPLVFSPSDRKSLYVGMQRLLKTSDGAVTWQEISPDLTVKRASAPANTPNSKGTGNKPNEPERGVIQTIAPSAIQASLIWVGTSTGLIHLTRDGGATWQDVTPRELPPHSQINSLEASSSDVEAAYATASAPKDSHPYIYRTRDAGKTWQKIVVGLPGENTANVVREDPARKGLLYAGTQTGVFVSFNGGEQWQPLQVNLPTTPVRDLAIHGSDLLAATYGRGLWILDDLTSLRQLDSKVTDSTVYLQPENGLRVRWDNWQETPLPADTPAGQNPPDGAIIDYYLKSPSSGEITLEILDERGNTVRRYSSVPAVTPGKFRKLANAPDYWFAPPEALSTKPGINRFVWDLRFPSPPALTYDFYGNRIQYFEYTFMDNAIPGRTPRDQPQGPLVVPGNYDVVLTVDGNKYHRTLALNPDPRLRVPQSDLQAQLDLAQKIVEWMRTSYSAYEEVASLHAELVERQKILSINPQWRDASGAAGATEKELAGMEDGTEPARGFGLVNRDLGRILRMIESGDLRPAQSARDASAESCEALKKDLADWRKFNAESLPALNKLLASYKLAQLLSVTPAADPLCSN